MHSGIKFQKVLRLQAHPEQFNPVPHESRCSVVPMQPCTMTFLWMTASSEVVTNSINFFLLKSPFIDSVLCPDEYQDSWDSFVTHSSLMHIICLDQNISFL